MLRISWNLQTKLLLVCRTLVNGKQNLIFPLYTYDNIKYEKCIIHMEIYLVIQILHVTSRFSETSRHLKALTSVNVGLPLLPIKQKLIEEIQTLHLKQPSIEANKFEYSGRFPYTTWQQWQVELALTNFCKLPLNLKESLTVFLPTTRIIIYLRL